MHSDAYAQINQNPHLQVKQVCYAYSLYYNSNLENDESLSLCPIDHTI